MAEAAAKLMTVAEFLHWDDGTDRRYELVGGRPVMMAPPGRVHGVLVIRLGAQFRAQLPAFCQPQGEAGIVRERDELSYFIADLAVSCAPMGDEPWCPEPILIVEVLSDSTRSLDLGVKLPAYRRILSVRHILLVETREVRIEHWRREADGWKVRDFGPGEVLVCEDLGLQLAIDALYEGLPVPATGPSG
jgi:Uma2 family endonuclease